MSASNAPSSPSSSSCLPPGATSPIPAGPERPEPGGRVRRRCGTGPLPRREGPAPAAPGPPRPLYSPVPSSSSRGSVGQRGPMTVRAPGRAAGSGQGCGVRAPGRVRWCEAEPPRAGYKSRFVPRAGSRSPSPGSVRLPGGGAAAGTRHWTASAAQPPSEPELGSPLRSSRIFLLREL